MIINKTQFDRWVRYLARTSYCLTEGRCPEEFLRHELQKELLAILVELGYRNIGDYKIIYCSKCSKYRLI